MLAARQYTETCTDCGTKYQENLVAGLLLDRPCCPNCLKANWDEACAEMVN